MPLYEIVFTDGSTYTSGENILDSKWDQIPDKDILRLVYFLGDNTQLVMSHFEEYAHIVEATQNIHGPKGTDYKMRLKYIYVMGCIKDKVTSYRITLNGVPGMDRYVKGDVTKREYEKGKEYRGRPANSWKKGIK